MKVVRYVLLVQFILVLGILAVVYAAPDLLLLHAQAAEANHSECPTDGCQMPTFALSEENIAGVQELPALENQEIDTSAVAHAAQSIPAAAPQAEETFAQQPTDSSVQDDMQALRQEQLAPQNASLPQSNRGTERMEGVGEALQLDPDLAGAAASQGVALEEMLRIQAELNAFVQEVKTGHEGIPRGVFVADTLTMPIRRQPASQPGFISGEAGVATQFGLAEKYGTIGLLAHNYLAGTEFFELEEGQRVHLIYGDGDVKEFRVTEIHHYRAGQPNSPYSDFYDLDNGGEIYSAKEIFRMMYNREGDVVFQTCIADEGISTWGRIFIIATPL
jgi:hypothetical protein